MSFPRHISLEGSTFHHWTVFEQTSASKVGPSQKTTYTYRCVCVCGREKVLTASVLKAGRTKSCGCMNTVAAVGHVTPIGARFGMVTVIGYHDYKGGGQHRYLIRCDCGVEKPVYASSLISGNRKSCGCFTSQRTHNLTGTKTYKIWSGMKRRCTNPNEIGFKYYGGRGISICERWMDSFENFHADMGDCPDGYSIERIDVNGWYSPENCIWIPLGDQSKNKRTTKLTLEKVHTIRERRLGGEKLTNIAKEFGVSKELVGAIVNNRIWKDDSFTKGNIS